MIEDIVVDDNDTAEVLITFFYNFVSNLTICEPLANSTSDFVLKCVVILRTISAYSL